MRIPDGTPNLFNILENLFLNFAYVNFWSDDSFTNAFISFCIELSNTSCVIPFVCVSFVCVDIECGAVANGFVDMVIGDNSFDNWRGGPNTKLDVAFKKFGIIDFFLFQLVCLV